MWEHLSVALLAVIVSYKLCKYSKQFCCFPVEYLITSVQRIWE